MENTEKQKSFIMRFIEDEGGKLDRIAAIVKTPNRSETIRYLINEFLSALPRPVPGSALGSPELSGQFTAPAPVSIRDEIME